jgi:hypothetical protein
MNIGIGATIKHHPYAAAGIAVGGLFLLLVLMRSSGGTVQDNSASTLQTIAAANAQQSQLAAQVGASQSAIASQNYQANLAAQVQNNQVVAAGQTATYQTDAQLIAALAANQTQQQATQAQLVATGMQVNLQAQQNYLTADTADRGIAAQLAAMGIQFNSQDLANQLSAQVTQHQQDTQLSGLQAQIQEMYSQSLLENQTYQHQMDTSLAATENTNASNLAAYNSQVAYQTNLANLQGDLTKQQIQSTTDLTSQGIWAQLQAILGQQTTDQQGQQLQYNYASTVAQNQYNLNNQIVGMVGQAGLNHGTQSLENSLTAILSGVMNQPQIGVAAESSAASQAQSTASMWSNITSAIASAAASIGGGLFKPIATPVMNYAAR